jgi:hypothetical protein
MSDEKYRMVSDRRGEIAIFLLKGIAGPDIGI